jgi:hypothetical protein
MVLSILALALPATAGAAPPGSRSAGVDRVDAAAPALRAPGTAVRADGRTLRFVDRRVARATRRLTGELLRTSERGHPYLVQLASGRQVPVRFRGRDLPDRVIGARVALRASVSGAVRAATITTPLRKAATATPTAHRAYVALVRNKGSFGSSDATIQATIDAALERWREESNGAITTFTRARTASLDTATDCQSGSAMWNEAASTLFPGVSTSSTSGNHVIVISPSGCAGGVGTVQAGIASGGRLNAGWNPRSTLHTLMHELGHNFSLSHANACYAPLGPDCVVQEYANTYAIMGFTLSNDPAYTPAALDSFERTRLGITDPGEVAPVALATGQRTTTAVYDLRARGTASGLRGLRITDPTTGTVYSVDWRSGGGRDALSGYALKPVKDNYGVTVERLDPDGRSAAVLGHANPRPSPPALFGLTAGRSFAADRTTIAVESTGDRNDPAATTRVRVTLTDPSVDPGAADPGTPDPGTPGATAPAAPGGTGTPTPGGTATTPGANAPGASAGAPGRGTTPGGAAGDAAGGAASSAAGGLAPAKIEVTRVSVSPATRRLRIVAPITARASGTVRVSYLAAGRTTTFDARIDARRRRLAIDRRLPAAQARAGTGIVTLRYRGDADTQPQTVRLRAASRAADLRAGRPTITGGRLRASGRIADRARGVVRIQVLFGTPGGSTRTLSFAARITDGRYRLDQALPAEVRSALATRRGVVHSYTLYTGDQGRELRGGLASAQVMGAG